MKEYPTSNENIEELEGRVKQKVEKRPTIDHRLSEITSSNLNNILLVQDLLNELKQMSKKTVLQDLRQKLIRLENDIGFKLEQEELDQHVI